MPQTIELARFSLSNFANEAGQMRGLVAEWDAINETFTNHDLMDVLGREEMVEWFKAAREADPDARLYINGYINDYAMLRCAGRLCVSAQQGARFASANAKLNQDGATVTLTLP